jgi:hypothetical protein
MGAPEGNQNAANARRYRRAIERALAHAAGSVDDGLLAIAKTRVAKAMEGNDDAAKEIGDRFDGKPSQVVAGDPDAPLETVLRWASEKS